MSAHQTSITLKELSSLTGFSMSTVSKALNNKLDISTETKQLITRIAEKYNYRPNSLAISLRNQKSSTVAIILPQINLSPYSNVLFNLQKIADSRDHRVVIFQSFKLRTKEVEYLNSICDGSIDGAIIITSSDSNSYSQDYPIPVLTLSIEEISSSNDTDEFCAKAFEKLLATRSQM